MRKQLNELEEDLNKERNDSVPWKSFAKYLQKILNDIDSGMVETDSPPFASTSHRDRKLSRAFDDLRGRIGDVFQQNEEEKEASQKQLQKVQIFISLSLYSIYLYSCGSCVSGLLLRLFLALPCNLVVFVSFSSSLIIASKHLMKCLLNYFVDGMHIYLFIYVTTQEFI